MITLLDVFDKFLKETKFDKKTVERAYRYHMAFLNRDSEHLAFFGGNLLGVQTVRFRVADVMRFYNEVVDVDAVKLEAELKTVTTIVQEYKISSDPMNLTLMYCIHRSLTSPQLSQAQRERAAYDFALIFFYRCITIRQSEYFHFPADPKIAQAAFAELNQKFIIKKLGSWRAVMEYRSDELIDKKGIHYKALTLFTDDSLIAYAISDSENRVRDMYKNYYKVFDQVYRNGNRIQQSSSTITDEEGNIKIREKIHSTEQYINYIRQAIQDKPSFIRQDLVKVISEINVNTSQRMISEVLNWLSDNYNTPAYHKDIDNWLRLIIIHSFYLLAEFSPSELKNYSKVLVQLKNLYLSTRSTDTELVEIRKLGDKLLKHASGSVSSSLLMATRTATILYITLRSLIVSISK